MTGIDAIFSKFFYNQPIINDFVALYKPLLALQYKINYTWFKGS